MLDPKFINDLLGCDPSAPVKHGVVLVVCAEMRSEFEAVRSEYRRRLDEHEVRIKRTWETVDGIGQEIAKMKSGKR